MRQCVSTSDQKIFARASPYPTFFFQAEDGIRDDLVTGVQTCALPISNVGRQSCRRARLLAGFLVCPTDNRQEGGLAARSKARRNPLKTRPPFSAGFSSQ